ncbi:DUF6308 family protein [Streptomyces scabiei]|uniref:DUF6308 family protein n=1 Tax=Streptomyces TaxID=1883 RepID=UPI001E57302D|nr:DUF6308 family protein [Streptomyces scabiei]MDX2581640.1 DUF6308 family protein [Streptomyces scabiei]MDX2726917.1 DUF6308 family protein [Streptomyces scabiei]MDX2996578.1 DUF6308 family protein [Streptomyces scabiei]MDX3052294.1 DUF6308 family protein [Streptomyces scabiei]MDX3178178.1 DUF6308 family protein [Streptomyces scabiei]
MGTSDSEDSPKGRNPGVPLCEYKESSSCRDGAVHHARTTAAQDGYFGVDTPTRLCGYRPGLLTIWMKDGVLMASPTATPGVSDGALSPLGQRLRVLLGAERVVGDLRRYFGIDLPPDGVPYTGSRFEHLAGGGDRPEVANRFTAEDLVAVQTLSVTVPAAVALDLLEGPLGARLSGLLHAIPRDIDMVDADADVVADGSPADQAWQLLEDQPDVGWVIAGKLLARKRPRLLPVYDKVVRCALGRPRPSFWLALHAALRADDHALHRQLFELRQVAGVPETVSALRICDVAVWMGHRAEGHACPR